MLQTLIPSAMGHIPAHDRRGKDTRSKGSPEDIGKLCIQAPNSELLKVDLLRFEELNIVRPLLVDDLQETRRGRSQS